MITKILNPMIIIEQTITMSSLILAIHWALL